MDHAIVATTLAVSMAFPGGDALPTPDDVHRAASEDLESLSPGDQAYTRYLSLHAIAPQDRDRFLTALLFWANSVSFRRRFAPIDVVADGLLARVDLRDFGWDKAARAEKLANAEAAGVSFAFADAGERARFLDVWEAFAAEDPYFRVGGVVDGAYRRGWIDPVREADARALSRSRMFVLRADWWLAKASFGTPEGFKGLYNELMFLPRQESELYRMLGADEAYIARERQSRGGARDTGNSIVAMHNRELEMIPTQFGEGRWLWRTRDTFTDLGDQSVRRQFAGTLNFDGRELIYSLPNGLHGYWLADGQGGRAEEVPVTLAQNKLDPHDVRVLNAYSCIQCHGDRGIRGFVDDVGALALSPDVGLAAISPDPDRAADAKATIEDFYFGDREAQTARQQEDYQAAVKRLTGQESSRSAENYLEWVRYYVWGRVDLRRASLEFGVPEDRAVAYLKASGDPDLLAIAAGMASSRESFERAFKAGAVVPAFPWEESTP